MIEFALLPVHARWFDLPAEGFEEVLRPSSQQSTPSYGSDVYGIEVSGETVLFSMEAFGIHVTLAMGVVWR